MLYRSFVYLAGMLINFFGVALLINASLGARILDIIFYRCHRPPRFYGRILVRCISTHHHFR